MKCCKKTLLKDTNKKKRLDCSKKHEQWTLDRWKSDESKFAIFGSNRRVFVRRRVGVVPTVNHGRGGVSVLGCFAGDTVCDLFRIQDALNQHGYHSILQQYAILSGGQRFVFQQDNDPTHLKAV